MGEQSPIMESLADMQAYDKGDHTRMNFHEVSLNEPPRYSAEAIKQLRLTLNVTQRVLARMLAVSPRTVEAWEAGRTVPAATARRLIEILTKDPQVFYSLGL